MNKEFKLPDVGEGLTEADIVSWHVKPGDTIEDGQVIVEIETAKAVVELPSPYAGTVTGLLVEEGQTVDVGTPIIAVEVGGTDGAAGKRRPSLPPRSLHPSLQPRSLQPRSLQLRSLPPRRPPPRRPLCRPPLSPAPLSREAPCRMPGRTLRRVGRRSSSATASSRDRRPAGRARSRRRGPGRIPRRLRYPRGVRGDWSPRIRRQPSQARHHRWHPGHSRNRRCGGSPGIWASTCPR